MPGRRVAWDVEGYRRRVRAACFVCEMVKGTAGYEHHIVHEDERNVVFLARYPQMWGHTLVAPRDHREHAVGDFSATEYLALQEVAHRAGLALSTVVPTERLYVVSMGSQQGNRHVHWHLVPLPPGVPYEEQQMAVFDERRGWLDVPADEMAALAGRIRQAMA